MPSEFSGQLAQMVAQSRYPQAPASRGHRVVGGGAGGMGSLGGKETSIRASVGIDLDALMRLFGYKTPEEKAKIGAGIVAARSNYSDEDWEKYVNEPNAQTFLSAASQSGVPGVVREFPKTLEEFTAWGEKSGRWNVTKPKAEVEARRIYGEPTGEKAKAGFYGPVRREEAIGAEERVLKAARPLEERMLEEPPEKFAGYVERKAELEKKLADAKLTEPQRQVLKQQQSTLEAEKDVHNLQVQIHQEKINFTPEQRKMDKEKADSDLKSATELQGLHRAQAQFYLEGKSAEAREEAKETREMKRDINKSFDLFLREWNKTKADTIGATPVQMDQLITSLKLETDKYISGMSGISEDLTMGNYPVGFWLSHVEKELAIDAGPEGKLAIPAPGIIFEGKGPEMDIRWQRYAREIVGLIQSMPKDMTDYNLIKSASLFTKIFEGTTRTPHMVESAKLLVELLKVRGKRSSSLERLIQEPPRKETEALPSEVTPSAVPEIL